MSSALIEPNRATIMIKPVGALCNLDCTYCYYLPTKTIYGGHEHRMSEATLEQIFASVLPRFEKDVTIAWQGGEPTLAGLGFFEQAIAFQNRYKRPDQTIKHALQTNGTLLDDRWCEFLGRHGFLVGLSMDGPPRLHDHYRRTNRGTASSGDVHRGLELLQKHKVEYNILAVLNDQNVHYPDEMMGYLLNRGSRWLQFIPAIEWEPDAETGENRLAPYSPDPQAYGEFLCRVFDRWFEQERTRVSIRMFDAVLNKLVLGQIGFCILDASCHNQLTIEHDGSVFGCDHFVEPRWRLAKIGEPGWENDLPISGGADVVGLTVHGKGYRPNREQGGLDIAEEADVATRYAAEDEPAGPDLNWFDRLDDERLSSFAKRKQHLPEACRQCPWKPLCHGGCPKHRQNGGDVPEPTVLCEAYKRFYSHSMERFEWLAGYLRRGHLPPPPEATVGTRALDPQALAGTPRNAPCPCGSGKKFKQCHGKKK
ncbi:MAG: radical SAM protein [Phycisphaeraceae bacterium]